MGAGDTEAAIEAFAKALRIGELPLKYAADPLIEIAEIHIDKGRPTEAEPLARIAAGLEPSNDGHALSPADHGRMGGGPLV